MSSFKQIRPDLICIRDPYTACPLVHLERRGGSQSSGQMSQGVIRSVSEWSE
ncbi:hypothetical protein K439DRAFT_1640983 [Ramaria rubella]|nr:hypothetical protein K439DRAFT_1640983 [Ramaria rubella]